MIELASGDGAERSRVHLSAGAYAELAERPAAFVVIDERVAVLHPLAGLAERPHFVVPCGEASKSFAKLEALLEAMAAAGVERDGRVLAIGGGVTTDLAGLAASLYMRGIAWEAAPTTLLAQVDASVGGKTAINGRAGKNLFGTFHAPRDVWIDPLVLATLMPGDWRSGLGEVLKAALLGARLDDGMLLFDTLEARTRAPLAGDPPTSRLDGNVPPRAQLAALAPLLTACLRLKAELVDADFREAGVRAHLNLGHTYGHGIEAASRYRVPHGIAVATGIGMALETARMRGVLEELALAERTARLTTALGLPADLAALNAAFGLALTPSDVHAHMGLDKKKRAGQLRLVLPQALGRVTVIATDAP